MIQRRCKILISTQASLAQGDGSLPAALALALASSCAFCLLLELARQRLGVLAPLLEALFLLDQLPELLLCLKNWKSCMAGPARFFSRGSFRFFSHR